MKLLSFFGGGGGEISGIKLPLTSGEEKRGTCIK